MIRHPLIVANWKMHTTLADAMVLATSIRNGLEDIQHIEVVLCPPLTWLVPIAELIKHHPLNHLELGAQNIYQASEGAVTGEVAAVMLKHVCQYVLVGHSERVRLFGETPRVVSQKAVAVIDQGLKPIICVGEPDKTVRSKQVVAETLQTIVDLVPKNQHHQIVVAYEPVWAISTASGSEPATGEYAQAVCAEIRRLVGSNVPILYGGSVDSGNLAEFLHQEDIDGVLVGGASLKAKEFLKICEIASGMK